MKAKNYTGCNDIQHLIVDALFGEIDSPASLQLHSHLEDCQACAQMFTEMQSTLQVTREVPEEFPPETYWVGFQEKLEGRIQAEGQIRRSSGLSWLSEWIHKVSASVSRPRFTFAYQFALAIVLVFTGVLIGRYGFQETTRLSQVAGSEETDSSVDAAIQLAAQTESYLNRSSILLLGLVNHDAAANAGHDLNFEYKREAATKLVQEAAVLKSSLSQSKEAQLLRLIDELEKILLQISNLELQEDVPGIELIQEGIEGRALLLKINLETMKLMDQPVSSLTNELAL